MDATQVNDLIEQTKAEAARRRQAAADELRALLLKEGKPGKSEHARLLELADVLDIRPEQLPEVLSTLQLLARYERILAAEEELKADSRAVVDAAAEMDRWEQAELERARERVQKEAESRRAPITQKQAEVYARKRELQEAMQWHSTVAAKWASIVEGVDFSVAFARLHPRTIPHGAPANRAVAAPAAPEAVDTADWRDPWAPPRSGERYG